MFRFLIYLFLSLASFFLLTVGAEDHKDAHTVGRTPLDRCQDLCLSAYNIHDRHLCNPAGFESTFPASEWAQTDALNHAATGIGF